MVTKAAQEVASSLDGGSYPEEPRSLPKLSEGHGSPKAQWGSGAKMFFMAFPFPVAHRGQFVG